MKTTHSLGVLQSEDYFTNYKLQYLIRLAFPRVQSAIVQGSILAHSNTCKSKKQIKHTKMRQKNKDKLLKINANAHTYAVKEF